MLKNIEKLAYIDIIDRHAGYRIGYNGYSRRLWNTNDGTWKIEYYSTYEEVKSSGWMFPDKIYCKFVGELKMCGQYCQHFNKQTQKCVAEHDTMTDMEVQELIERHGICSNTDSEGRLYGVINATGHECQPCKNDGGCIWCYPCDDVLSPEAEIFIRQELFDNKNKTSLEIWEEYMNWIDDIEEEDRYRHEKFWDVFEYEDDYLLFMMNGTVALLFTKSGSWAFVNKSDDKSDYIKYVKNGVFIVENPYEAVMNWGDFLFIPSLRRQYVYRRYKGYNKEVSTWATNHERIKDVYYLKKNYPEVVSWIKDL